MWDEVEVFSLTLHKDWKVSPHFSVWEFACKGEDIVIVNKKSLLNLERLRDRVGEPVGIRSAFRTNRRHYDIYARLNRKRKANGLSLVDVPSKSRHITPPYTALDVTWKSLTSMEEHNIIDICQQSGFNGIGINLKEEFVHVDEREVPAIWGYK